MKKKIAMISYHTCPLAAQEGKETGGMNVYVLELSQQLVKLGYEIDIYTRLQDTTQPHIVELNPNLRVIHVKAGPTKTIPKKELACYIPEFIKNCLHHIEFKKVKYDFMHCHYYMSGLAGIGLNKAYNQSVPLITTFHTLALMKNLVARDELEKEEIERIDAEFLLTKVSDAIIAPSESDSEYLEFLYDCDPKKIYIVSPGYDEKLFKQMSKEEAKRHVKAEVNDKIVLFVGRIEPLKGIDGLMYAIKILTKKNPNLNTCLWIVGGDITQHQDNWSKELQKLEELRKILSLSTSVRFVGQQTQEELPYYLNAAEVVVIPSHYESFGMAALEAMACGTPVITTNAAGVSNLLDKNFEELVTSANNPLLLSSQIEHLLKNEEEFEAISKHLLEKMKNLTWSNTAEKISKIYQEL